MKIILNYDHKKNLDNSKALKIGHNFIIKI